MKKFTDKIEQSILFVLGIINEDNNDRRYNQTDIDTIEELVNLMKENYPMRKLK